MNSFANISRRGLGRVTPAAAPADVIFSRVVPRRDIVCAWRIDPISNRPVCSWEQARDARQARSPSRA